MIKASNDPKQQAILESAWEAFSTYGFRKTSMDDIARRAGMSRPALYLSYRNKEAIFAGLVEGHYGLALDTVADALASGGTLSERLHAAFEAQGGPAMKAMMDSPHGLELFEAGMSAAGEAIATGELALRGVYAQWLRAEADAGQITLPGNVEEVARVFCSAMKGIKHTSQDYASYASGVAQLAALFGAALQPD
ncbi:TetR/AcrR family transcriptional regulator [Parasedimentitalea maritima]|uniref:TetR/AcrR family transcriptional regulator n=1 Tax=Parasedimentitalea maritima TaxID=2578117 RepID=A0ABY2UYJ2_9RHOB|nr:TetR/AcrR family transcriptional regulator [Zongyanglinia marina]TLP67785.1 TetR/AcrR family transcriptional regulator [Zongyanglinia marina]